MNSAIAHRTPEDVLDEWSSRFGLGDAISAKALEPHFEALERELNAHPVSDDVLGENNRLFLKEATAHGLPAKRMQRYERGCRGSSRCVTGCPNAAKQGMNVSYVPWALALGARMYCSCRVERVVVERGQATGVVAHPTSVNDGVRTSLTVRLRAPWRSRCGQYHPDAQPSAPERLASERARTALPVPPRLRSGRRFR